MKIKQTGFIKKKKQGVTMKVVCFSCRKCFHRQASNCVECQGKVHEAGSFFRAPKKNDIKSWKILEKMIILARYRFSKYGASGVMPENLKQADQIVGAKIRELEPKLVKSSWTQKKDKGFLQPKWY